MAKLDMFGESGDNVKYTHGICTALKEMGHEVLILVSDCRTTLKNVLSLVLVEEVERKKKLKETMSPDERRNFIVKWKSDNDIFINNELGVACVKNYRFLTAIMVVPSTSKVTAPLLVDVVQADGAHMSFGKDTLFTAYAKTANANMSPLAYGIHFGNEDKASWSCFWSFLVQVHPWINDSMKTIMTDQDKGSIESVKTIISTAHQFFCAYHRRCNIIKTCGGGSGKVAHSALWMFNLLGSCNTVEHIAQLKAKYLDKMFPTDRHYLEKMPDEYQYSASRCAKTPDACMHGSSTSSGAESMNKANMPIRRKTAVDMLNAMINLLKMDSSRYDKFRNEAWEHALPLTPRGMIEMEKAYEDDNTDPRLYRMQISELADSHVVQVSKTTVGSKIFTVVIPKKETLGSCFGSCTCGAPATKGLPCRHMVVVAKTNKITGLKRVMMMPSWWTTVQWRKQFPKDSIMRCDINMQSIKKRFSPDDTLRYYPVWSAPGKKGRPKKDERRKGVMDHIKESGKKRKRWKSLYCTICELYNHNTVDCFKNPLKKSTAVKETKTNGDATGEEDTTPATAAAHTTAVARTSGGIPE
jgi:hypothetical protein